MPPISDPSSRGSGKWAGKHTNRLRARTFCCMGTVVSLTVPTNAPDPRQPDRELAGEELEAATAVVKQIFAEVDAVFSLFRPESEASRLARGELTLLESSQLMRRQYADAATWRLLTEGSFTPERPDRVLDLAGIVKGNALKEAGISLLALGQHDWCLNAGGDILVSGSPVPGSGDPWRAGIVDPRDRQALLAGFPLGGSGQMAALATSGTSERGDHIWSAGSASEFLQVSVASPHIVTADVLATAIVAGGQAMLDRAVDGWNVDVLAVQRDGQVLATPGFRASVSG